MQVQFDGATRHDVKTFTCVLCNHSEDALVTGIGEGVQSFLNAAGTAERRATVDAEADIQRVLAVTRCPKCGKRDPAAVRWWWFRREGPIVVTSVFVACLGWLPLIFDINMTDADKWLSGWTVTGIAVLVGLLMGGIEAMKWGAVDGQVVFEPPRT